MTTPVYALSKLLPSSDFDQVVENVTNVLKEEGFGVLTEIDIKATLKKKIDVDFRRYLILGACNPALAHKALLGEPYVGLLLPCNVIVTEEDDGTRVSVVNPREMFRVVDNDALHEVVDAVDTKMRNVINNL